VDGQKIGTYTFTLGLYGGSNAPEMTNSTTLLATFFGHKRVGTFDRLGSAKYNQSNNAAQSFYPYGEDRGTVEPNDELKFATYTRDAATGLDYADQRYYANNFGRFMSADRYASANRHSPQSWNRYSYVRGDPIGFGDPSGQVACNVDGGDVPCDLVGYEDLISTAGDGGPLDPGQALLVAIFMQVGLVGAGSGGGQGGSAADAGPPPICEIQLFTQSVKFEGDPYVHTFLEVSIGWQGTTTSVDIEAGPAPGGYLNRLDDGIQVGPTAAGPGGVSPQNGPSAYPTAPTQLTQWGPSSGLCPQAFELLESAGNFPPNTYTYNFWGVYNSNSFTYTVLTDVGIPIP
jgi:RHS repeat-associated protein